MPRQRCSARPSCASCAHSAHAARTSSARSTWRAAAAAYRPPPPPHAARLDKLLDTWDGRRLHTVDADRARLATSRRARHQRRLVQHRHVRAARLGRCEARVADRRRHIRRRRSDRHGVDPRIRHVQVHVNVRRVRVALQENLIVIRVLQLVRLLVVQVLELDRRDILGAHTLRHALLHTASSASDAHVPLERLILPDAYRETLRVALVDLASVTAHLHSKSAPWLRITTLWPRTARRTPPTRCGVSPPHPSLQPHGAWARTSAEV